MLVATYNNPYEGLKQAKAQKLGARLFSVATYNNPYEGLKHSQSTHVLLEDLLQHTIIPMRD